MRDVLFVQGAGEGTHAEWDIHLVKVFVAGSGLGIAFTTR